MTTQPPAPKGVFQQMLSHTRLYRRLKSSVVYDLYWTIKDPSIIAARRAEVEFYRTVLRGLERDATIFDVGANQGYKTDMFLRLGARVVAVDPDENNQQFLRSRFLDYRLSPKAVSVEPVALGEADGAHTMWIDAPGSAKNTLSTKWVETLRRDDKRFGEHLEFGRTRTVQTTTLDRLIQKHGVPFYIKIDVEGYEVNVLAGLSRAVPYVSFEVNLPEFANEGRQCLDRLWHLDRAATFNYTSSPQLGMGLTEWLPYEQFLAAFANILDNSVDIFCRRAVKT